MPPRAQLKFIRRYARALRRDLADDRAGATPERGPREQRFSREAAARDALRARRRAAV